MSPKTRRFLHYHVWSAAEKKSCHARRQKKQKQSQFFLETEMKFLCNVERVRTLTWPLANMEVANGKRSFILRTYLRQSNRVKFHTVNWQRTNKICQRKRRITRGKKAEVDIGLIAH